jgi:Spy/CpxP family protein refolding chaperone
MKRVIILFAATLLLIGSSLNAQPGMGYPPGKPMMNNPMQGPGFQGNKMMSGPMQMNRMERMKMILKLTDEQESKINDIKFEHDNAVLDIKNDIAKNRLVVRKMMTDNKIDEDKLLSLTSTNAELRGKLSSSKINMWLSVYNILDDTQKEQWTKMFGQMGQNSMQGKKGGRKGNCGNFPQGRMMR